MLAANMQKIIHKCGKGPDHAQDLTREEADVAFRTIVRGEATPLQVGGFLIALRTKGETGVEIASCARALRELLPPAAGPFDLDLPCYAGKAKTFRAVPAAALVLKAAGVRVCVHTYDDAPGRQGMGPLLEALEVPYQRVPDRLHEILELRKELGVRSIFNVGARLLDPGRVGRHLVSITHQPYFEKLKSALTELGERALIFQGSEGETEAPYHGVVKALHVPGDYATYRPEDSGLTRPRIEEIGSGSVEDEVAITKRVLAGEKGPHRTIVLMTAAAGFCAARDVAFAEALKTVAKQI